MLLLVVDMVVGDVFVPGFGGLLGWSDDHPEELLSQCEHALQHGREGEEGAGALLVEAEERLLLPLRPVVVKIAVVVVVVVVVMMMAVVVVCLCSSSSLVCDCRLC